MLIALVDLLEAEGRAFRRSLTRVAGDMALIAVAGLLAVAGFGLCLWAVYGYLAGPLDPPTAALLTGLLALAVAGGVAWIAGRTND